MLYCKLNVVVLLASLAWADDMCVTKDDFDQLKSKFYELERIFGRLTTELEQRNMVIEERLSKAGNCAPEDQSE